MGACCSGGARADVDADAHLDATNLPQQRTHTQTPAATATSTHTSVPVSGRKASYQASQQRPRGSFGNGSTRGSTINGHPASAQHPARSPSSSSLSHEQHPIISIIPPPDEHSHPHPGFTSPSLLPPSSSPSSSRDDSTEVITYAPPTIHRYHEESASGEIVHLRVVHHRHIQPRIVDDDHDEDENIQQQQHRIIDPGRLSLSLPHGRASHSLGISPISSHRTSHEDSSGGRVGYTDGTTTPSSKSTSASASHGNTSPAMPYMGSLIPRGSTDPVPHSTTPSPRPSIHGTQHPHAMDDSTIETTHVELGRSADGHPCVNQYAIMETIGKGSYGTVKRVLNTLDGQSYAMKVMNKSLLRKRRVISGHHMSDHWELVKREIAIMKKLKHPNVVRLYEVVDDPEQEKLYLVMEYLSHGSVSSDNTESQRLSESLARSYFRDAVLGLHYLHYHRVVHRDLKPENLLVSADGHVKIADFGVSQLFEGEDDRLSATAGSAAFMAPEICLVTSHFSGRATDIWSLGVTLYVFICGRLPFVSPTVMGMYESIIRDPLTFPDDVVISPSLHSLIEHMLIKDPTQRITLQQIISHPWVTQDGTQPLYDTWIEMAQQGQQLQAQTQPQHSLTHSSTQNESTSSQLPIAPSSAPSTLSDSPGSSSAVSVTASDISHAFTLLHRVVMVVKLKSLLGRRVRGQRQKMGGGSGTHKHEDEEEGEGHGDEHGHGHVDGDTEDTDTKQHQHTPDTVMGYMQQQHHKHEQQNNHNHHNSIHHDGDPQNTSTSASSTPPASGYLPPET